MTKCLGHSALGNNSRMMRYLRIVLDVSLYPHSNIISVNVKLMSQKYASLPYLTFSEPHFMSENTRLRTHQRTIPHRNEQCECFFPSPCGEIYLYNCHLSLSQTHTHTHTHTFQSVSVMTPPGELPFALRIPRERGHDLAQSSRELPRKTAPLLPIVHLQVLHTLELQIKYS